MTDHGGWHAGSNRGVVLAVNRAYANWEAFLELVGVPSCRRSTVHESPSLLLPGSEGFWKGLVLRSPRPSHANR